MQRRQLEGQELEEARANALHEIESQYDQEKPLQLIQSMIEWMDEEGKECKFDQLAWDIPKIDNLIDKLEELGIWFSKMVNPYANPSISWIDVLRPLIKEGRTARICSFIQVAKKDSYWKTVIDLFTTARAQLELQDIEKTFEPDFDLDYE